MAPPNSTTPKEGERVVTPFAGVLQQLDKGNVHAEVSIAFADAYEAVHTKGGKASITLTLTVEPSAKGNLDQLAVSAVVTTKIPRDKPKPSIFFVGKNGEPTRNDPHQPALEGLQIAEPVKTKVVGQ